MVVDDGNNTDDDSSMNTIRRQWHETAVINFSQLMENYVTH